MTFAESKRVLWDKTKPKDGFVRKTVRSPKTVLFGVTLRLVNENAFHLTSVECDEISRFSCNNCRSKTQRSYQHRSEEVAATQSVFYMEIAVNRNVKFFEPFYRVSSTIEHDCFAHSFNARWSSYTFSLLLYRSLLKRYRYFEN